MRRGERSVADMTRVVNPCEGVALSRPQVRNVICPECGAGSGERCVGARGKIRTANHMSRVQRAYVLVLPEERPNEPLAA